jgi:ubiquinone/menaquinone biosynthesis C-methylase UbiE
MNEPQDQPSTYFVQDKQSKYELERLAIQDRIVTTSLGGPLPEQPDPTIFHRILDIGCGTGGWAIETAQTYPISVIGIDSNRSFINYAREQAMAARVADRVEFAVMDAVQGLEFRNDFFNLVNQRLGASYLRTWDWTGAIKEMQRVTISGGIICLTESGIIHYSNSPSLTQLFETFYCSMLQAGHLFEASTTGIIDHLARLLTQQGCLQVQEKDHLLEYQGETAEGEAYYNNMMRLFRTLRPFFDKWKCTPEDYDALYQQALTDMQQSTFRTRWPLRSAWGINP